MEARLGGKAEYADRVRLGHIILIVRDIGETGHISSVGVSMEAVAPTDNAPAFLSLTGMAHWLAGLRHKLRAAVQK